MDYLSEYKSKLVSAEEALSHIPDGAVIGLGGAAAEPAELLSHLHSLHGQVSNLRIYSGLSMHEYPFLNDPKYRDTFSVDSVFFMSAARKAHSIENTACFPAHLHNAVSRWGECQHPNVCMIAAVPMDRHGYFRIAPCLIQERYLLNQADLVIVEVNPNMPHVMGDTELSLHNVNFIVESDRPLPVIPASDPNTVEQQIGHYISELVHDGDTFQLGIGGIPDAAAHSLLGKHDLGVHTEMLTNSIVDLIEAGVITGRKKSLYPRKIVASFALGEQRLYDMIDQNPGIVLKDASYLLLPSVIAKNRNMISINTALTVDLGGQVCSESIGSLQYSGSGGQADTAVGALHAPGGRNVIALKSTAETRHGRVSTILPQLPLGSVVTLSRNDVDHIVTEYGIAYLRGRSVRQRVENLISIAHPDFRNELRDSARSLHLW